MTVCYKLMILFNLGPVHEEPELYPMADIIQVANPVTDASNRRLIDNARQLANYWVDSIWNVKSHIPLPEIETWHSRQLKNAGLTQISNDEIKKSMLKHTNSSYFPPELLEDKFIPHKVLHRRTQRNLRKLEEREKSGEKIDKTAANDIFSEGESAAESNFGDEDYAVNHYEEGDDDFGDEEGGDEGGIF